MREALYIGILKELKHNLLVRTRKTAARLTAARYFRKGDEMEDYKSCFLCDNPAGFKVTEGESGNRIIVSCSKSCPTYEITRWAIKKLVEKPERKTAIIQKIKAFTTENPNDLPVIRKDNSSFEMVVTTRSRESKTE